MANVTLEYVEQLAAQLSPEDRKRLAQRLTKPEALKKQNLDLYGAWRGKFPEDVDLDAELKEIRRASEKEWNGDEFVG